MTHKRKGTAVVLRDNEHINQALRRFKQKIDDTNKINDIRQHEFYEKPTTMRKRKKSSATSRWLKTVSEQLLPKKLF